MKSTKLALAALGALMAALIGSGISAPPVHAEAMQWKMHIVWVSSRPEASAYQEFVDRVNKNAKGKLHITLYPGGSLGVKDVDMLRILPPGNVIQAAGLYPGYMTRDEPQYASLLPPGVAQTPEQLVEALPTLSKIYQATYDKWGIVLLGYVGHPIRDMGVMCKEPVSSLAQLKGKKLRVWEKSQVDTFSKLGVSAQVIPQNELYLAMQRGVVDCAVYSPALGLTISLQEVAPYASTLFPYVLNPLNIIVSKKSYDSLSADVQKVLVDAAKAVQDETFKDYLAGTRDAIAVAEFKKLGGTMLPEFPAADRALFAKTAREVWEATANGLGPQAIENWKLVSKAIGSE